MSDPEAELPAIIDLCAGAQLLDERGGKVAYLPAFTFDAGGTAITQNLLFVPASTCKLPVVTPVLRASCFRARQELDDAPPDWPSVACTVL